MLHPVKRGLIHVINWLYVWLPRFTGCHTRPDRSFRWRNGMKFPVCARCTGELCGMLIAAVTAWLWEPPVWAMLLLAVPMVADGFIQLLTKYESTNPRRFVTGILFGYSLVMMIIAGTRGLIGIGYELGMKLKQAR